MITKKIANTPTNQTHNSTNGGSRTFWSKAITAALATAVTVLIVVVVGALFGYVPLAVRSGSMSPTIATGDLIVTKKHDAGNVSAGQIVTFNDPDDHNKLITHRVVSVQQQGGANDMLSFTTRGDANDTSEQWTVKSNSKVGVYKAKVPKAGYVMTELTTPLMRTLLVTVPALLLGLIAIRRLWFT